MQEMRSLHATSQVTPQSQASPERSPCIWSIAGGKGGVGKTALASNLGVALARRGKRCVLVDLDLGGANLHTVLGVPTPARTLSHFLKREVEKLSDICQPTSTPNLTLVSGAQSFLDIANLKHAQKERLIRHIGALDADHVILDISAGSAYNALDFFLVGQHRILTVVPEATSIENAYHFLKAAFFRSLKKLARRDAVSDAVARVLDSSAERRTRSPRSLFERVTEIDQTAGKLLQEGAKAFSTLLIVNQARTAEHRSVGHKISFTCKEYLGTRLKYLGALQRDECVRAALDRAGPVLDLYPGCPFARDLNAIVDRVLEEESSRESAGRIGRPCTITGSHSTTVATSRLMWRRGPGRSRDLAPTEERPCPSGGTAPPRPRRPRPLRPESRVRAPI